MGYLVVGYASGCVGFLVGVLVMRLLLFGAQDRLTHELDACLPWRPERG